MVVKEKGKKMFYWDGRIILFGVLLTYSLSGIVDCNDFDPLPAGVRSVISSNHLTENTPEIFAEYHALLPNFRGDYGIKSKLVEAATKDPVYKGSETFILPLYIPNGAIPFPMHERTARSGSANGQPNMRILRGPTPSVRNVHRDLNRPILRRIVSTSRRHFTPRHNPTAPPSFNRPWIRRRGSTGAGATLSKAARLEGQKDRTAQGRKGLIPTASESVGRISVSEPDNAKITLKKVSITPLRRPNARITNPSKANITGDSSESESKIGAENFESKRKITKIINRVFSTTISSLVSPDLIIMKDSQESATNPDDEVAKWDPKPVEKSSTVRIKPMMPMKPEERKIALQEASYSTESTKALTTDTNSHSTSTGSVTRLRLPGSSTELDSIPHSSSIETVDEERTTLKTTSTLTPYPLDPMTKKTTITTPQSSLFPLISTTEVGYTEKSQKYGSTSPSIRSKNNTDFHKSAAWLLRRRASLRKTNRNGSPVNTKIQAKNDHQAQPTESRTKASGSIIDRVLSSAASQTDSTTTNPIKDLNTNLRNNDNDSNTVPERNRKPNTPKLSQALGERRYNNRPASTSVAERKIPRLSFNRKRVPIRVRNPVVSNSRAVPKVTTKEVPEDNSTVPEIKTGKEEKTNGPSRSEEDSISTNSITTSTPKLPWIDSTKPSSGTKIIGSSKRPFVEAFRPRSSPIHIVKSPLDSSFTKDPSLNTRPRLRSAQDIVLEKLSKLMADATNKSKSVDDIAKELEILNQELSLLGIHIIDAEFGGHKLKLRNYQINPYIRGRTTNSSKPFQNSGFDIEYSGDNLYGNSRPINYPFRHDLPIKGIDRPTFVPKIRDNSPILSKKFPEGHRMKSSSQNNRKQLNDDNKNKVPSTTLPVVVNSNIHLDNGDDGLISATSTLSPSEVTRTRTTVVPIVDPNSSDDDKLTSILDWQNNAAEKEHLQERKTGFTSPSPVLNTSKLPTREPSSNIPPDASTSHSRPITPGVLPTTTLQPVIIKRINEVGKRRDGFELNENIIHLMASDDQLTSHGSEDGSNEVQADQFENISEEESYVYLFGLLGIVPFTVLFFLLYRQRKKRQEKALPQREEGTDGFTPPTSHARSSALTGTLDAVPPCFGESQSDSPWEFPRSKLRLTSIIGEGNFGMVWKAEARNLCDWDEEGDGPTVLVAVKGVKEGAGAKEKSDLLKELSVMQLLAQHNNIVTLLGCCTTHEPYFLVMEYVMYGKLLTFLRDHRSRNNYYNFSSDTDHLTSRDLTKFACQIATGCEYLQSRGVIHRDLAARNILVDHNKVCKIADFGLARSVKDLESDIYEQKSRGPLPIRWMAPESLYMSIFTHKSDVWSFGILCWEIVTLGSTPYPGVSAREVMRRVREGYRLERPEHCHTEFYQILTQCWSQDLNKRPSFTELKQDIKDLLESATTRWIDLENFQEATYYSMHENNDEKL